MNRSLRKEEGRGKTRIKSPEIEPVFGQLMQIIFCSNAEKRICGRAVIAYLALPVFSSVIIAF